MRLYPMVDGEVAQHVVETVIDQQKFVNRLVGLLDEILGASAKGAVLYPVDQLPDGMTWKELRRLGRRRRPSCPSSGRRRASSPASSREAGAAPGLRSF